MRDGKEVRGEVARLGQRQRRRRRRGLRPRAASVAAHDVEAERGLGLVLVRLFVHRAVAEDLPLDERLRDAGLHLEDAVAAQSHRDQPLLRQYGTAG